METPSCTMIHRSNAQLRKLTFGGSSCVGTSLATELAHQLRKQNREVAEGVQDHFPGQFE